LTFENQGKLLKIRIKYLKKWEPVYLIFRFPTACLPISKLAFTPMKIGVGMTLSNNLVFQNSI